jgi:hypothetical protein
MNVEQKEKNATEDKWGENNSSEMTSFSALGFTDVLVRGVGWEQEQSHLFRSQKTN